MHACILLKLCKFPFPHTVDSRYITRSSGPEKYARYNETLLYQGYKNSRIQRECSILGPQNYLVIMKPHYISAH